MRTGQDMDGTDGRELIAARLGQGVRATPLCRAIMGWIAGVDTLPSVAQIRLSADGQVWLRLSDEAVPTPACTFLDFLDQVRVICGSLGMTEEETRQVIGWAQMRLF